MKNLLLFFALVCASPVFSQVDKETSTIGEPTKKFTLSILGGLNINFMPFQSDLPIEGGSINSRLEAEHAFFAGISARQPISKRLAAKLDAQFAVRGYGIKRTSFAPVQEHYQASYLDFVPQVEYKVFKNIYLSLGGYAGIFLEERIKYSDQNWTNISPQVGKLAEGMDFGLASGLRLEFGRFSALAKYQHGLTPGIRLESSDDSGLVFQNSQFHRSLQLGLGFRIL